MFLFLILLFPTVLCFCALHSNKKIYPFIMGFGAFCGVIVTACTALFSYMHRIPEYSFFSNFVYFSLKEYVLPLILLYAIYFFVTKDSVEFRIKAFFPLISSFYAIYMPYCIIAANSVNFSFFILFVKPVIFLSSVFLASFFAYKIYGDSQNKNVKKIVFRSVFAFVMLLIPPAIETMYLLCIALPVVFILSVLYGLFALILFFINSRGDSLFLY